MKEMFSPLRDRRLWLCALVPAAFFALMTVWGGDLRSDSALFEPFWPGALWFALLTAAYGAAVAAFVLLSRWRAPARETRLTRVISSFPFVLALLLACWLPVWLAFWPGTFSPDSITQFYAYDNGDHSSHHPLLHTLLLGFLMTLGIDLHPEGDATWGLAIYCGVQLVLTAGCLAWAVCWLRRRGAPAWARALVALLFALFPFYAPWGFYAQKDVLFGASALVMCLLLADLWRFGLRPMRLLAFAAFAVLMMLLRKNGVYALILLAPFAVWWMKGGRARMAALLAGCVALYMAASAALSYALEASDGSRVEMLSIPLQQMTRTMCHHPEARALDEEGVLEALFGDTDITEYYDERIADPVKWNVDEDALDAQLPALLKLWLRMGARYPADYLEAFLAQNLPYLLPGAPLEQTFDFGIQQPYWYPIEEASFLPGLRAAYETYEDTLSFLGIPGTRLLSHPAFWVWMSIAGFACAAFWKRRGLMAAFGFLLAVWLTCLLGPVALMRYVLAIYYAAPVLLCALLSPAGVQKQGDRIRNGAPPKPN